MRVALPPVLLALLACTGAPDAPRPEAPPHPEAPPDPVDPEPQGRKSGPPFPALGDDSPWSEDCTRASVADAPLRLRVQPTGAQVEVQRGSTRVVESVTLEDGSRVRVSWGGCAHDGELWHVTPAPPGTPIEGAKAMLAALAHDPSEVKFDGCLETALDPAAAEWSYGEGLFSCSARHEGGVLALSYDFSM